MHCPGKKLDLHQRGGFPPSAWSWAQPRSKAGSGLPPAAPSHTTPAHQWSEHPGYWLTKREDASAKNLGCQKVKTTARYWNVFSVCQNFLLFGISLRSMLSGSHNARRMCGCGCAISGAFLIRLRLGCFWLLMRAHNTFIAYKYGRCDL